MDSLTFTICKHRMPCGWCELRNEECKSTYTYPAYPTYPQNYEPNTVQVYAAPSGAPTIEPKKGKWIDLRSDGRFGKETRCSKCGEIYWEWMSKFDYCPNCGARMDG